MVMKDSGERITQLMNDTRTDTSGRHGFRQCTNPRATGYVIKLIWWGGGSNIRE